VRLKLEVQFVCFVKAQISCVGL